MIFDRIILNITRDRIFYVELKSKLEYDEKIK